MACALSACATAPHPGIAPEAPRREREGPPASAPWVRSSVPEPLAPIARTRPATHTRTLKNGLKVVVVEDPRARLVETRLFFSSGSAADPEDHAGATWFALALLGDTFDEKDSDERPTRLLEKSARYLAAMAGASLVYDVAPDISWIGIDGYAVDTGSILKRLQAVITERRHGEDSFQGRAQSVADMINEIEISDGAVLEQYLTQLAFGADHPYARPVFGTPLSLSHLGIEDVIERQRHLLTPVGTTLVVAGGVEAEDVFRRAELAFGKWKGNADERVVVPVPVVSKRHGVVFLPRKPSRNTLVCLARPLSDVKASAAATRLAVAVLGEARMSGMLREKLGLTYSVTSTMVERRSARALLVCARVKASETINATRLMLDELSSFGRNPATADELESARAMAITEVETAQDELSGIVALWRHAQVMKWGAPSETEVADLRQVTREELADIARKLSATDTVQVIFSGERPLVEGAARANALGPLRVPTLGRVTE
jgi:zinc protease